MADIAYRFQTTFKGTKGNLAEVKARLEFLLSLHKEKDENGAVLWLGNDDWFDSFFADHPDAEEVPLVEFNNKYEEAVCKYFDSFGIRDNESLSFDSSVSFGISDKPLNKAPYVLFVSMSRAFPNVSFFVQVSSEQDNGEACGIAIYKNGKIIKEWNYDYTHLEPSVSGAVVDFRWREASAYKDVWFLEDDKNTSEYRRLSDAATKAKESADRAEYVAEKCRHLPYSGGILDLSGNCNDDNELEKLFESLSDTIFHYSGVAEYFNPENITEINLSGNGELSVLPESIYCFTNLTRLILLETKITEIPAGLFAKEQSGILEITRS